MSEQSKNLCKIGLINEREAAQILGLSVQTLRNDRATKRRWPYVKLGKAVRYRPEILMQIIERGTIGAGV